MRICGGVVYLCHEEAFLSGETDRQKIRTVLVHTVSATDPTYHTALVYGVLYTKTLRCSLLETMRMKWADVLEGVRLFLIQGFLVFLPTSLPACSIVCPGAPAVDVQHICRIMYQF